MLRRNRTSAFGAEAEITSLLLRAGGSSSPTRPIAPFASLLGVEFLTAEVQHELLRMFGVRKPVHVPPLVFMKDRVAGRAQRQIIAERVNNFVAAIKRYRGGQRDLVRPSAVYSGRGKFAFPVHHARVEERAENGVNITSDGGRAAGERTRYCIGNETADEWSGGLFWRRS